MKSQIDRALKLQQLLGVLSEESLDVLRSHFAIPPTGPSVSKVYTDLSFECIPAMYECPSCKGNVCASWDDHVCVEGQNPVPIFKVCKRCEYFKIREIDDPLVRCPACLKYNRQLAKKEFGEKTVGYWVDGAWVSNKIPVTLVGKKKLK